MTRVDFYQIETDEPTLAFACRLIEKIYRLGMKIHIHTVDAAQSAALDDMLWDYRPEAFIPHALYASSEAVPVKIGHAATRASYFWTSVPLLAPSFSRDVVPETTARISAATSSPAGGSDAPAVPKMCSRACAALRLIPRN